ncbi:sulfatase [Persicobacter psychrovividus]|uniref:Sulfatase N-terminal domain-containing protein n=1 Tax=Persicobacter psychrovividus TaxID=387638 RepID=A0ABN6LD36_9BACT|nr:hypothetical protein PEPS_30540 [Persicobacter psychrovividus]
MYKPFLFFALALLGCNKISQKVEAVDQRPNIIWLVAEDLSPRWACYGDSLAYTPNINKLAEEGVVFDNVFSVAGVCAPSRAGLITGCYSTSIGTQHMRQAKGVIPLKGVPNYNAVPPAQVKAFPELLRSQGYWTASYRKLDYQFGAPFTIWDEVGPYPSWRHRSEADKDRPFFMYYTFEITHEVNIWPDSTKENFFKRNNVDVSKLAPDVVKRPPYDESKKVDPASVSIPPFLPDTEISRRTIARLYDNISRMDVQIGTILKELEEDGLADNTIIFVTTDHGDCLPRSKRWIYDSGIKCPLIVYCPDHLKPEALKNIARDDRMYSFIDFAPTVLDFAGIKRPEWMQGRAMFSELQEKPRTYIHAGRDRMDNRYDTRRAVRSKDYKYIRNFLPEVHYSQPIKFLNTMPLMHEILTLDKAGKLTHDQSYWLYYPKNVAEELYDINTDPFEMNNLAADTIKYAQVLQEMRTEMSRWLDETNDLYQVAEVDQAAKMWPGGEQPKTAAPAYDIQNDKIILTCDTEGATIAYQLENDQRWHIYHEPLKINNNQKLLLKAIRYGYEESPVVPVVQPAS